MNIALYNRILHVFKKPNLWTSKIIKFTSLEICAKNPSNFHGMTLKRNKVEKFSTRPKKNFFMEFFKMHKKVSNRGEIAALNSIFKFLVGNHIKVCSY